MLLRDNGNCLCPQIQTHHTLSYLMTFFAIGCSLTNEPGEEAIFLPNFATHQTDILHPRGEATSDDLISGIKASREKQSRPLNPIPTSANATGIVLPLHGIHLVLTLKSHAFGLSHEHFMSSLIGPAGDFLHGQTIEVLSQPGVSECACIGVEGIVVELVGGTGFRKAESTSRIVFGQGICLLKALRLADETDAPCSFPKTGIIDLPGRFQPREQGALLGGGDAQGQFTDERWRPYSARWLTLSLFDAFACFCHAVVLLSPVMCC